MTPQSPEAPALTPDIRRVVERLIGYGPERIILFGSRARGDAREFSDIDLIVVKETDAPRRERTVKCREYLPKRLGVDIDTLVYTPAEIERSLEARNPFIAAAFTDGIVVYDKHPPEGGCNLRSLVKEPTMESRLTFGRGWIERADADLRLAQIALDNCDTANSCFHSQQAAEKALKGFLVFRGKPLERTHSAGNLADCCALEDTDFLASSGDAHILDSLYIDTRYPDEATQTFKNYEPDEARRMLERADRIVSLARSKIPSPDDSPDEQE